MNSHKTSLLLMLLITASLANMGCSVVPVKPDGTPEPVSIDQYMKNGARTMWIAPHPDDEFLSGPILARSGKYYHNPLYFLVLTHGEGGHCGLARGCTPDLGAVRGQEMVKVAKFYGATLQNENFFNAPLPVSSFPKRQEIYKIWKKQGDPELVIAKAIRKFKPDLVISFDPDHGASGHPEHQLAARLAIAGIRMAADPKVEIDGLPPHRTGRLYHVLNRYWLMVLLGQADPPPVTEEFDTQAECTRDLNCLEFMLHGIRFHRSQFNDMQKVARFRSLFETLSLRQVDPYTQWWDPAEPAD